MAKAHLEAIAGRDIHPPRSPARQALASAIARRDEAIAAIEANARAIPDLRRRIIAEAAALAQAEEVLEGAKTLRRQRVLHPDLPEPKVSVRDAEVRVEELREALAVLREALAEADDQTEELERRKRTGPDWFHSQAVSAVLCENDDAVRALYAEAVAARDAFFDARRTLDALKSLGAIPAKLNISELWQEGTSVVGPVERKWLDAIQALKDDPDVLIPK